MTAKRFRIQQGYTSQFCYDWQEFQLLNFRQTITLLNSFYEENEQLKQFIKELTTKGTGRIDLASGYSYNVNAVLTNWKGDVE